MKRIIRIPFGILLCPVPILIGSIIWLFDENTTYGDVLEVTWHLVSGQWSKLPD